jgi:hypothetical protein
VNLSAFSQAVCDGAVAVCAVAASAVVLSLATFVVMSLIKEFKR